MEELSDAGSIPARSIICGKEGSTKQENFLSPGRCLRTEFVLRCVCLTKRAAVLNNHRQRHFYAEQPSLKFYTTILYSA